MAKLTWLGEDGPGIAGPSFTTCFGRKFHKDVAVEVDDVNTIKRAKGNPFFHVDDDTIDVDPVDVIEPKRRGRPPKHG